MNLTVLNQFLIFILYKSRNDERGMRKTQGVCVSLYPLEDFISRLLLACLLWFFYDLGFLDLVFGCEHSNFVMFRDFATR